MMHSHITPTMHHGRNLEGSLCSHHPPEGQGGDATPSPPERQARRHRGPLRAKAGRSRPSFPRAGALLLGMTLEQALSRQADAVVLESDEQSYRKVFSQALASLQGISDRVEKV